LHWIESIINDLIYLWVSFNLSITIFIILSSKKKFFLKIIYIIFSLTKGDSSRHRPIRSLVVYSWAYAYISRSLESSYYSLKSSIRSLKIIRAFLRKLTQVSPAKYINISTKVFRFYFISDYSIKNDSNNKLASDFFC